MASKIRTKIKLVSTGNTGYYYTTTVNAKTKTEKLKRRKYDPVLRQHVIFEEKKVK